MTRSRTGQLGWIILIAGLLAIGLVACSDAPTVTVGPTTSVATTVALTTVGPIATAEAVPSPSPVPPTATPSPAPTETPAPTATLAPSPTPVLPSNDGRWVAYIARDGTLYSGRTDGSRKQKVAENVQTVEWSPDGSHFIYYKRGENLTYTATYEGLNPRQLTTVPGYGKWLAGGKNILLRPGTAATRRYTVISDADGKTVKEFDLPNTPGFFSAVFDLTPDSKGAIYYLLPQEGQPSIGPTSTPSNRPTENTLGRGTRPAEYRLLNLDTQEDRLLAANLSDSLVVWNADYTEIIAPDLKDNTIKAITVKLPAPPANTPTARPTVQPTTTAPSTTQATTSRTAQPTPRPTATPTPAPTATTAPTPTPLPPPQPRVLARYNLQTMALFKRDSLGKRVFWLNPVSSVVLDGGGLRTYPNAVANYPAQGIPSYYLNVAPDGNSLIYASGNFKDQGGGVFRVDLISGKITRLADNDIYNPPSELFAGASYDNKLMAFTVRTDNAGTYLIKEVDSGKTVGQIEGLPVWQPVVK